MYVIDVPGLACTANLLHGPRGWRVRLCATVDPRSGGFAFCGPSTLSPGTLGVTFGEFRSSGAAVQFLAEVVKAVDGADVDLSERTREAFPDEEPDAMEKDFFFLLEEGADPVSGSRAAVVLLFDVESPTFDGDVDRAIVAAKGMPVRNDPAPADFYDRRSPAVPAAVAAVGGIGAVLSMSADESMAYVAPGRRGETMGVDEEIDDENWSTPPGYGVRPMGVLARDVGEDVARVASPLSSKGNVKLKVDESIDDGVREDGVMRRSYSVFTVMKMGELQNARLRAAMTGMFHEQAAGER